MHPVELAFGWIFGGFVYVILLANGFYKGELATIRERGVRLWLSRDGGDWIGPAILMTLYHAPLLILLAVTVWAVGGWF